MTTWLGALLAGPALLLGSLLPGFGSLDDRVPVPSAVVRAVAGADLAPRTGGHVDFNDPFGSRSEQFVLVRRTTAMIRTAGPDSTVRMAAYSLALPSVARALVAAHDRGAQVRVVVDDHSRSWGAVRRLRAALGADTSRSSFVTACRLSCRGGRGNQHAKFLLVGPRGGTGDDWGDRLVAVGSMNLTRFSNQRQWNDLFWVRDPGAYDQFAEVFDLMVADRAQPRLSLPETRSGFDTDVAPYSSDPGVDPLRRRLAAVGCRGAARGTGRDGRTVVRIAMHAWNGSRGIALAERVARLQRQGCDLRVLYGSGMGRAVATVLREAGVPVRDSAHQGRRVHEKMMLVSGVYDGQRDADLVWTGSHNWSDRSVRNDEIMLRVAGRGLVRAYRANHAAMWSLVSP